MNNKLQDLQAESAKLRQVILQQAAQDGGHVGPPLGAVEIIQALLHVYDFKKDKIFFDVGHQMHAYKILTDRHDSFHTMDKKDGIGEFPNVHESPYDFYTGGHSGLSISAALGYAVNHKEYKSIALIGDGSMTGGQPYEALNHAGELQPNILVIYNDNDYSITTNTGALHTQKRVQKFSESLGFEYVGTVDGHNLGKLIDTLEHIKEKTHPIFLHITTIKGKGYPPAEKDPVTFHSMPPFNITTGRPKTSKPNQFKELIIQKTHDLQTKYKNNLYLVSPAAARSSGLKELKVPYPKNVFDTGMSEQHCITFSAACALNGNKVICFIPAIFLPRALDQIIDVCLLNVPIVFVLLNPGIGATGPTHQGIYTFPMLNMLPSLEVYSPASLAEFSTVLDQALEKKHHPVFIQKPSESIPIPYLDDIVGLTDGDQLTVVSVGNMLGKALALAQKLNGIQVVHVAKIKPLNLVKLADYIDKTNRLLILEDGCVSSGIGQQIISHLSLSQAPYTYKILGVKTQYPQFGTLDEVLDDVGIGNDAILHAAKELIQKSPTPTA